MKVSTWGNFFLNFRNFGKTTILLEIGPKTQVKRFYLPAVIWSPKFCHNYFFTSLFLTNFIKMKHIYILRLISSINTLNLKYKLVNKYPMTITGMRKYTITTNRFTASIEIYSAHVTQTIMPLNFCTYNNSTIGLKPYHEF